jgi:hypothetical protein
MDVAGFDRIPMHWLGAAVF